MDIQEITTKAAELNRSGEKVEALRLYNKAFEMLVDEASIYAHKKPETFRDSETTKDEKVRTILPRFFDETKKYLKRDTVAHIIQKNMAVIFHELGDRESAINTLEQAVDLAPDGYDIGDAQTGLKKLKN